MIFIYTLLFIIFIVFSLRYNWWRIPQTYSKPRVLMYHSISEHKGDKHDKWRVRPSDFECQMLWLKKNGFQTYTMSEICELKTISRKGVCITFDDGYENNFTNAFPVLKKLNFKATIYVVPNQNTNHWESKNTKFLETMLSKEQISAMIESGLIEFGSHTLNHLNLATITNQEAKFEIENSKKEIEKITNQECKSFAYPYGKFDDDIISVVKNSGYTNAVIVKRGLFDKNDRFAIKRIGVLGTESFFDFYLKFTRIRNKL